MKKSGRHPFSKKAQVHGHLCFLLAQEECFGLLMAGSILDPAFISLPHNGQICSSLLVKLSRIQPLQSSDMHSHTFVSSGMTSSILFRLYIHLTATKNIIKCNHLTMPDGFLLQRVPSRQLLATTVGITLHRRKFRCSPPYTYTD